MVVAVTMVKDEADIVAQTVGHMLAQVDHVIVADNGSTDGTREIVEALGADVRDDPEPGYYQSQKITALASEARSNGAQWVVPFDADEFWKARADTIADTLRGLPDWVLACEAALYDHVPTGKDRTNGGPVTAIRHRRRQPAPLPKWAVRAVDGLVIHQGNHGADFPGEHRPPIVKHLLTIRHFPYRSPEQFVAKVRNGAAAYAASDLPEDMGAHWRQWGQILNDHGEEALVDIFRKWYFRENPDVEAHIDGEVQPPLVRDPAG